MRHIQFKIILVVSVDEVNSALVVPTPHVRLPHEPPCARCVRRWMWGFDLTGSELIVICLKTKYQARKRKTKMEYPSFWRAKVDTADVYHDTLDTMLKELTKCICTIRCGEGDSAHLR